jgi:hypothetical protein
MQGKSYRLNAQTLGILSENQHRVAVLIPYNAVITVVSGPLNGNRMVDVMWDEKVVMIFVEDLRERGELTNAAKASSLPLVSISDQD